MIWVLACLLARQHHLNPVLSVTREAFGVAVRLAETSGLDFAARRGSPRPSLRAPERRVAIQKATVAGASRSLDCFVAPLLAMTLKR